MSNLVRYVAVIAIVAGFTTALSLWDSSAPRVAGWDDFMDKVSADPFEGMPEWPVFQAPNTTSAGGTPCAWWDVPCHTRALASTVAEATAFIAAALLYGFLLLYTVLVAVFAFLSWFFTTAAAFFVLLISAGSLTLTGMPQEVQWILWAVVVPFWASIFMTVLKLIRGAF